MWPSTAWCPSLWGHVSRLAGQESATVSCGSPVPPSLLSIYIQPNFTPQLFFTLWRLLPLTCCTSSSFPSSFLYSSHIWWLGLWRPSAVGMVDTFIITICAILSNLLYAVWRRLVPYLAAPDWERGSFFREFMEELSPSQLAVKRLKQQFLEALRANNAQQVLQILHTRKLDIDVVLEVDDPSMVLASYKQGEKEEVHQQFIQQQ